MAKFKTVQAIQLPGDPKTLVVNDGWAERHDVEYPDAHLDEFPSDGLVIAARIAPDAVVQLSPFRFIQCYFMGDGPGTEAWLMVH